MIYKSVVIQKQELIDILTWQQLSGIDVPLNCGIDSNQFYEIDKMPFCRRHKHQNKHNKFFNPKPAKSKSVQYTPDEIVMPKRYKKYKQ